MRDDGTRQIVMGLIVIIASLVLDKPWAIALQLTMGIALMCLGIHKREDFAVKSEKEPTK